jgi:hypothetical protein
MISMDVTEFEVLRLDAGLFEIPAGMTEAANAQQLAKAISDANEARLAQGELGVRNPRQEAGNPCASASLKSRTRRRRRSIRARSGHASWPSSKSRRWTSSRWRRRRKPRSTPSRTSSRSITC